MSESSQRLGLAALLSNYSLGIIYLLAVVLLWTTSNFITQDLYEGGYNKPFLVTYLNTTSFTFYLLPYAFAKYWGRQATQPQTSFSYQRLGSTTEHDLPETETRCSQTPQLTDSETARLAVSFWFLWFLANWTLNTSLEFTSVASSTVLASTSGFFTLLASWVYKMERVYPLKVVGILTSFVGVALVANSDHLSSLRGNSHSSETTLLKGVGAPLFGDVLALASAVFYALYVTLLKIRIQDESRINMPLFFGFVGLFNIFLGLPVYGLLHASGIEEVEWPSQQNAWVIIVANMIITLTSDYLYVLAMLKTTPLVVTVGISLTIPFALVGDYILNTHPAVQAIAGSLLVLGSFVAVGLPQSPAAA